MLTGREPYSETVGVIAAGVKEALVQDYDDVLRVAPAVPSDWDVDGTVTMHDNAKVDVQTRNGLPVTVALEAGSAASFVTRNPWPGESVGVVDAADGSTVVAYSTAAQFTIPAKAGHDYLIQRKSAPVNSLTFQKVSGTAAELPEHLGKTQIGLDFPASPAPAGPVGALTAVGGLCVGHASGLANGTAVQTQTCDGGASQVRIAGRDGALWVQGKCVMPAGKSGSSGTALVLAACDGSTAQQWKATSNRTLVNQASGLCAEIKGSSTTPGIALATATCNTATAGQKFDLPTTPAGPQGHLTGIAGMCADSDGGSQTPGTALVLNTCGSSDSQQWRVASDATMRLFESRCMTPDSGAASGNGSQVVLQICDGSAVQKWHADADGTLVNDTTGKCVALKSGAVADGTKALLADCNASSTDQQWTWAANRGLVSKKSGTCLDATGPSSANGTPLQIWACAVSDNQRWQLPAGVPTGHVTGLGGKCVGLNGSGSTNAAATALQLNTCGTGISQDWSVAADGSVQVLGSCVGVANNATASGTAVTLQVCNGSNGQKWTTGANSSLVNTLSGRCLDATDASSANGTELQIWTCGGSEQQKGACRRRLRRPQRSGPDHR
ncbi:ricin-type beta-trefoil lectin domain protein [Streptomyces sp. NPDC006012]|uniref:RICIN domain-containing protein n=1 Tax=Streptomyces sp. NPDC006012 TaxID=3364739 RepID=UPI00369577DE